MSDDDAKRQARLAVHEAIRKGLLARKPCEECGSPASHAHHHLGYEPGHWLDVQWLCPRHHGRAHHRVMATHKWEDVRPALTPAQEARVAEIKAAMADAVDLAALREQLELRQSDVAARMQIAQPQVSRLERREDLYLSTLRTYVAALGGQLRLVVEFPDGTSVQVEPAAREREALAVG